MPFATDANGDHVIADVAGGGGPIDAYVQALLFDPAQTKGIAFTNAVKLEVLP